MCSTAVKVKLFTAYFNNVYMCALWVNYRKTAFQQFKVAYNNSYRILNRDVVLATCLQMVTLILVPVFCANLFIV